MSQLDLFRLDGKVALVSGASRGIGEAIALALGDAGAMVVCTSRNLDASAQVAQAIQARGGKASALKFDVGDHASIAPTVEKIVAEHGGIDILFNVAGINKREPVVDVTPETYDQIMDVNLKGAYFTCQAVGRQMIKQGRGGKIVNIASLTSHSGLPKVSVYGATKGGVLEITRIMAAEWGPHNIQVNAISPGYIMTELTRSVWTQEHMVNWLKQVAPAGRVGLPEDMVGPALLLASKAGDYITGQTIIADGGVLSSLMWPL